MEGVCEMKRANEVEVLNGRTWSFRKGIERENKIKSTNRKIKKVEKYENFSISL